MHNVSRLVLAVFGVALALGTTGCMSTPEAGQITVVRNGGPFDDRGIRQIVNPGSSATWTGFFSKDHGYPVDTQQRLFTFADGEEADSEPITLPTKDGVRMQIFGTFYFNTAFNPSKQGVELLKKFDDVYGTRPYNGHFAWETEGWPKFLNAVVQPVIDSNMREIMDQFTCVQLVSTCALAKPGAKVDAKALEGEGSSNVKEIQDKVNDSLQAAIKAKLGADYFSNIRFSLGKVELPEKVQGAVDKALAEISTANAEVQKAEAKVQTASKEAQANRIKQQGYNRCRTCAEVDKIKALPDGLQALGTPSAFGLKSR